MSVLLQVIVLTGLAAATIPLGAALACIEDIQPQWLEEEFRHSVIAFGGGLLLAAVALVLVPHGVEGLSLLGVSVSMCLGGVVFFALDVFLGKAKTPAAQLVAMLSDFLPEALALGAAFASEHKVGLLLALLIAFQNFPEGFNAYRELIATGRFRTAPILAGFAALVPLGPVAGIVGLYWLAPMPRVVSVIMLFAAGGILYLTFQDIAPQAKLEYHWGPPLGAVVGFVVGVVGQMVIGA